MGASLSGEPNATTTLSTATLHVGINRTGFGIPTTAGWPEGVGYAHYKWRLDGGAWSPETPINTAISLTGLTDGPHSVEVSGKRDSLIYQDDPLLGAEALLTRSRTWTVATAPRFERISINATGSVQIEFTARANTGYTLQDRDALTLGAWQTLAHFDPVAAVQTVTFADPLPPGTTTRFYRLRIP